MARDVGQRLLNDTERRRFDVGRESPFDLRVNEVHVDASAVREAFDESGECGQQTEAVERRWPQIESQPVYSLHQLIDQRYGFGRSASEQRGDVTRLQHQLETGQHLTDLVVQLARDLAL